MFNLGFLFCQQVSLSTMIPLMVIYRKSLSMRSKHIEEGFRKNPWEGRILFALFSLLIVVLSFSFHPSSPKAEFPRFGQNDFLEYWSAYHLAAAGKDYTNPELVSEIEIPLGWGEPRPLMMWNPPWTLSILSPLLRLEFDTASRVFLSLNLFCLLLTTALMLDIQGLSPRLLPFAFLFASCSVPVFFTLHLGQVSILLLLATTGFYWSLCRGRDFIGGIFLFLLTIKIHVVFLFLLSVFPLLSGKRIVSLILGAFFAAFSVLLHLFFLLPGALTNWMSRGKYSGHPLLVDVYQWRTTSVVTLVRDVFEQSYQLAPPVLMFGIPLLASSILLGWEWRRRRELSIRYLSPGILPLSCLFSPFAWIFDASVGVLTQLTLFQRAFSSDSDPSTRRWIIFSSLSLQILVLFQVVIFQSSYEYYWHYNLTLFLLWYFSVWRTKQCR